MELQAPSHWRTLDFISDVHLHAAAPQTRQAWADYLQHTVADAVLVLGDLFEVWVGDDALQPGSFEAACAQVLRQASSRLALYLMPGNRDFLMGPAAWQACGAQPLADPTVLVFGGQRWLLSHGDALCLEDRAYQSFRAQVRSPAWAEAFLAKPLAERQALARAMRDASSIHQQSLTHYADLDPAATLQCLQTHGCHHLLHGHTHRPGDHALDAQHQRSVLSDWEADATPPRTQVLRLRLEGTSVQMARLDARAAGLRPHSAG